MKIVIHYDPPSLIVFYYRFIYMVSFGIGSVSCHSSYEFIFTFEDYYGIMCDFEEITKKFQFLIK